MKFRIPKKLPDKDIDSISQESCVYELYLNQDLYNMGPYRITLKKGLQAFPGRIPLKKLQKIAKKGGLLLTLGHGVECWIDFKEIEIVEIKTIRKTIRRIIKSFNSP